MTPQAQVHALVIDLRRALPTWDIHEATLRAALKRLQETYGWQFIPPPAPVAADPRQLSLLDAD